MLDKAKPVTRAELVNRIDRTPVYRVLLLANLIGQPFFGRFGKRYGMTLNEWRIMMAIATNPGISVSEICLNTGLHIMNVSRGAAGLVRQGRAYRKTDPADRRRKILDLTEEGEAVFRDIAPGGLAWADSVFSVLDEAETAEFDRLLAKMIDHINAGGDAS